MTQKATLYFRGIPRARKDKFKSECSIRGDSMQDVIQALMCLYSERPDIIDKHLDRIRKFRKGLRVL